VRAIASENEIAVATIEGPAGAHTAFLCPATQIDGMDGAEVWALSDAKGHPVGDFAVYNGQIICMFGGHKALGRESYRGSIDKLRDTAQRAFVVFEFPPDMAIEGMTPWNAKLREGHSGEVRFTRIVYARRNHEPYDLELDTSHRIVFHAIVAANGKLRDSYALDMQTGNAVGETSSPVALHSPGDI
jgi:hypothetical protein